MVEIGSVVAAIDLLIGVSIFVLASKTAWRLRGGVLFYSSVFLLLTGLLYVVHAAVEVFGLGEEFYAVTALTATLFLGFAMVIIHITIDLLRGKP